jgi:hypothetical protein
MYRSIVADSGDWIEWLLRGRLPPIIDRRYPTVCGQARAVNGRPMKHNAVRIGTT